MKIIIKNGDGKKIHLRIPTRLIKWKWIYSFGLKQISDEKTKQEIMTFKENSSCFYKTIRKYIKENGHFTLVDIKNSNGEIVKIII